MLHICCIRAGEAFSPDYVLFLKDMIARNLEGGFEARFVCFTDRPGELPDHIETAPLPAELPGWWSKLALFREGLFPAGASGRLYFAFSQRISAFSSEPAPRSSNGPL